MSRITVLCSVLALGFGVGCSSDDDDGDARTSVDAGPTQTPDRADSGHEARPVDAGGSPVPVATLPPGTCGVLRRITVSEPFERAVRVPGAFVVGDANLSAEPMLTWRAVADDGARQSAFSAATTQGGRLALLPLGTDPFAGSAVQLSWGGDAPQPSSQSGISSEVVRAGMEPSAQQVVGAGFRRGTSVPTSAVSFDGARAVFAIGHVAVDDPHAFLIDASGARMGDAVKLTDTGNSPLFDCLTATSTLHAGAVSMTDRNASGAETWNLIELAADGSIAQRVTMDATELAGCPQVQLGRDGLTITMRDTRGGHRAYTARDGSLVPIEIRLALLQPESLPLWMGELTAGRWLVLQSDVDGTPRMAQRVANGAIELVPGELPKLRALIASEPGRLFAVAATDDLLPDHRDILELGCALD